MKKALTDLLAYLGGVLSIFALSDPWVDEQNRVLRLKILLGFIVAYCVFRLVWRHIKDWKRTSSAAILSAAFVFYFVVTPTFPMNLLDYVPTPDDFHQLDFKEGLSGVEAYKAGIVHYTKAQYSKAEVAFRYALSDSRVEPYAANRLAASLRLQEKNADAVEAYEKAIRLASKAELTHERTKLLWNSWHDRGWTIRRIAQPIQDIPEEQDRWQDLQSDAYNSFMTAAQYDPRSAQAWFNAGQINLDRGELREAREKNLRAYYINTQYSRATYNLALIEAELGKLDESLNWLARTFQIDGTQIYNAEDNDAFKELRTDPKFKDRYDELAKDAKMRVNSRSRRANP